MNEAEQEVEQESEPVEISEQLHKDMDDQAMSEHIMFNYVGKIIHQTNKAYCESIGDFSQVDWEQSPEWQQNSVHMGIKYMLEYPDASPADVHNNWVEDKKADGWTYGEVKDEDKKEHPCMVEYMELPQEQRSKDYIFRAIVRTMLA